MRLSSANANSYPHRQTRLAVYTRRTVLNVAMLLRDSAVARQVRAYLLDAEEHGGDHTPAPATCTPLSAHTALASRVSGTERALSEIGSVLQELGPVIHHMSIRLARVDQRLEDVDRRLTEVNRRSANTDRVVCEMSHRLADMRSDLNHVMREQAVHRARRESSAS
ncbi:hemolysin XhlA family protein [Streptomyces oceani]|uniref:hemolysin XhlA family protein n=1 Tax=Streptomyces oceani TaxID=1075402 RepID=UPI000A8A8804|nr:hemolysin XhlA family protein [Streptomyces oceani]